MKKHIIILWMIITGLSVGQTDSTQSNEQELDNINGLWIIDLRPNPESEPYLKEFIVKLKDNNGFEGSFYDTEFSNGKINVNWERIYFSFSTKDANSNYHHSGYFKGNKVLGITSSPERGFTMPWRGTKKMGTDK